MAADGAVAADGVVTAVVDALVAGQAERAEVIVARRLDDLRERGDWVAFATFVTEMDAALSGTAAGDLAVGLGTELVHLLAQRLVQALVDIGSVQRERPRGDGAAEITLDRALAVAAAMEDEPGRARALVAKGLLLKDQVRLGEAREVLREAVAVLGEDGDPVDRGAAAMGLGLVEQHFNRHDAAAAAFGTAVEAFETTSDGWNLANALTSAGQSALDLGRADEAVALLRRAWELARAESALDVSADVANTLAGVALDAGRDAEAEPLLRDALAAYRALGDPGGELGALVNLGIVERNRQHFDRAREHLQAALELARTRGSATDEYEVLLCIGDVDHLDGDVDRAETRYRAAVRTIERARPDLPDDEDAVSFFDAARVEANDRLVVLAGERRDAAAAFEWVERGRARELRRRSSLAELPTGTSLPADLGEREQDLVRELRAAEGRETDDAGRRRTAALERELVALRGEIAAIDPVAGLFRVDDGLRADVLHDLLAPADGRPAPALVSYYQRRGELWVFVLRPDDRTVVLETLPFDGGEAARFVATHLASNDAVRAIARTPAADGIHRFDVLTAPIVRHVPAEMPICLVPHGALHMLPFHVLDTGGSLLAELHPLSYAPSATFAVLSRHRPRRRPRAGAATVTEAAVFGDPHGDLRGARREAEEVARSLRTEAILDGDATPDAVSRALATCDVVHVAGHAIADREDPLRSGLDLAGGLLRAPDVLACLREAGRAPSLVVLSGCATGAAEARTGDELIGLARGFLAGGVASLVLSLWDVSDRTTRLLMADFHRRLAGVTERADALPISCAEALRTAQLARRGRHRTFESWAAFVLLGDPT